MGNTIESSEVTENSLLNKKTTESNPEYYGNIALLFFFVSLYIYYKGRRHFHAIILSNYSKIKKHKSIFKKTNICKWGMLGDLHLKERVQAKLRPR